MKFIKYKNIIVIRAKTCSPPSELPTSPSPRITDLTLTNMRIMGKFEIS